MPQSEPRSSSRAPRAPGSPPLPHCGCDGPQHLQATLTRAEFESLAGALFEATIEECRQAMEDAGVRAGDIDEVIMVGGSSRIPKVQGMVESLFGRPLNKSLHPDEVVAIGAAVQASILGGETKAVTLLDVTNFSLRMRQRPADGHAHSQAHNNSHGGIPSGLDGNGEPVHREDSYPSRRERAQPRMSPLGSSSCTTSARRSREPRIHVSFNIDKLWHRPCLGTGRALGRLG